MAIAHVVVVGGGIMGNGIAQVVAQSGLEVTLVDISKAALEKAGTRIERSLGRSVKAKRLTQADADATLTRLRTSTDLTAAAAEPDDAIETVVEDLGIKRGVLAQLDAACRDEAAGPGDRLALVQPAAGDGPDRDHPRRRGL